MQLFVNRNNGKKGIKKCFYEIDFIIYEIFFKEFLKSEFISFENLIWKLSLVNQRK